MQCGLALLAHNQENQWYVDIGCSKHMIGKKIKFMSLNEKDKGNIVTFGNNALAIIKGRGVVSLDKKIETQNVLYVEALKKNILSVS